MNIRDVPNFSFNSKVNIAFPADYFKTYLSVEMLR